MIFFFHPRCFQANAIGRGAKSVREFLEKNYTDEAIETDDLTIKLVIKALLEVSLFPSPGVSGLTSHSGVQENLCTGRSCERVCDLLWASGVGFSSRFSVLGNNFHPLVVPWGGTRMQV